MTISLVACSHVIRPHCLIKVTWSSAVLHDSCVTYWYSPWHSVDWVECRCPLIPQISVRLRVLYHLSFCEWQLLYVRHSEPQNGPAYYYSNSLQFASLANYSHGHTYVLFSGANWRGLGFMHKKNYVICAVKK